MVSVIFLIVLQNKDLFRFAKLPIKRFQIGFEGVGVGKDRLVFKPLRVDFIREVVDHSGAKTNLDALDRFEHEQPQITVETVQGNDILLDSRFIGDSELSGLQLLNLLPERDRLFVVKHGQGYKKKPYRWWTLVRLNAKDLPWDAILTGSVASTVEGNVIKK